MLGILLPAISTVFFENFDKNLSTAGRDSAFVPACDIDENEKAFVLSFDLPGFKKEDVNVEINGNTLSVTGKRTREVQDAKAHRVERQYGEYRRSFSLPENVKGNEIVADYDDGVLRLTLPKTDIAQKRKIEIGKGNMDNRTLNLKDTNNQSETPNQTQIN